MQSGEKIEPFILEEHVHKYKISFLKGTATLHVCVCSLLLNVRTSIIKAFLEAAATKLGHRSLGGPGPLRRAKERTPWGRRERLLVRLWSA